jgi:hypothetical protein
VLSRLLRLIASSAIPGGGFLLGQWSPATALALYWFENLIGGLAMAVRISEHQRLTGDDRHRKPQLGFTTTMSSGKGPARVVKYRSFFTEFLSASTAFGIAHGVFLIVVLMAIVERPDYAALKEGAISIALCHAVAVTVDLFSIQNWPFERLKSQAENLMGRTILVQFALIGGTWLAIYRDSPQSFFSVFVWLKTAADIAGLLPSADTPPPVIAVDGQVEQTTSRKKRKR